MSDGVAAPRGDPDIAARQQFLAGESNIARWWQSYCSALFGFRMPPSAGDDEQGPSDSAIPPLLWPLY